MNIFLNRNEDFSNYNYKKILLIKIGTNCLIENNRINKFFLKKLAREISVLKSKYNIVIVSSGAVKIGKIYSQNKNLNEKSLAALGQTILTSQYHKLFLKNKIQTSLFLLTKENINQNTIQTLKETSENSVLIINENDAISHEKNSFFDNDRLTTEIALKLDANKIIFLTKKGALIKDNKLVKQTNNFNETYYDKIESQNGKGGLKSKLKCIETLAKNNKKCYMLKAGNSIQKLLNKKGIYTEFINNFK